MDIRHRARAPPASPVAPCRPIDVPPLAFDAPVPTTALGGAVRLLDRGDRGMARAQGGKGIEILTKVNSNFFTPV